MPNLPGVRLYVVARTPGTILKAYASPSCLWKDMTVQQHGLRGWTLGAAIIARKTLHGKPDGLKLSGSFFWREWTNGNSRRTPGIILPIGWRPKPC
jgi:hypothetical protein